MFIVTRKYRLPKESFDEVVRKTEKEAISEFSKIPGFIDYYYLHSDGQVMAIGLYETREAAEESTRVAGDWVKKNIPNRYQGPPEVFSGEVLISSKKKEKRGEAA